MNELEKGIYENKFTELYIENRCLQQENKRMSVLNADYYNHNRQLRIDIEELATKNKRLEAFEAQIKSLLAT